MAEYIKRDALRQSLLIGAAYLDEDTMMTVVNVLDCFPAADVAPVMHGRWEPVANTGIGNTGRCSICRDAIYGYRAFKFCPNCGADMRGE